MTSKLKLIILTIGALILFLSFSANPPNGKTGAPGENTCNQCHIGSNSALDGELSITGLPTHVDANTTYPITLTLTNPNGAAVRGGFQWVAIDEDNDNAGDINNASTGSALMMTSGREYHEHSGSNFFNSSPLTWTSDWTAPNLPQGAQVTFHAAGVIGNGSGSANDRVRVISEMTTINASSVPLDITIDNQEDPSCFDGNDGQATLTVTGGTPPYFYDWDNGEDTNPALALEEGNNNVDVSDSNGNNITFTVTLDQPSEIFLDEIANNSPLCLNDNNGTAEVEATGGNSPYLYSWSDGQSGPIAVNLSAGFYTVQAEDSNGCIESLLVTITEEGLPVTIEGDNEYCEGTSLTLIASPGYNTYSWNTGEFTDTIVVNTPDTYSVLVSDMNGCTGVDYITITELAVTPFNINGPSEICPSISQQLSLTEDFTSYLWNNGSTLSTLEIDTCDLYTVIVIDSLGCEQTQSITVNCPSALEIILIENSPVSCIGDCDGILEAGLADNSNSSGSWSTGSSANRITDLCPGTYIYTVIDNTGCSASQSFEVVDPVPITFTIDTLIPPICHGDSTSFIAVHATGGVSPYNYFWPEGMTGDTLTDFGPGMYQVTIVDNKNCVDSFQVTVPDVLPLIIVVEDVVDILCTGDSTGKIITSAIGGHGGYNFQWNTGSTEMDIFDLMADTYALTITDSLGCSTTKLIPVMEPELLEYSAETLDESENGANDGSISLSVIGGSEPYSYLWSNDETTATINNLDPGTYSCVISDDNNCQLTITEIINEGVCLIAMSTLVTHLDCFGDNDGSISVEVANGIPPFEIVVTDSDSNPHEANELIAGQYTVTVEDSAGCSAQEQVMVTSPSALEIEIQLLSTPSCEVTNDGEALVSVLGGEEPYEYLWDTESTDPTTSISSGLTAVTVTDAKGCQISAGITVGFEDTYNPEVILKPLTVDISSSGGFLIPDPLEFNLASNDNCSSLTFSYEYEPVVVCGTATYNVEILVTDESNNSTIGMTTLTVRDINAPIISCPSDISISFCEEVVYEVSATDNCGDDVILTLVEGLESQAHFEVGTTIVRYSATDNSNNVSECEFMVTKAAEKLLTASTQPVSCYDGSDGEIIIEDNGVIYTEVVVNGEESLNSLEAGDYTVLTVDSDGCQANITVTIDEPNAIDLSINSVKNETMVDSNDGSISTSISGGVAPYQLAWYVDEELTEYSTTDIDDLKPGVYSAQIIDFNGCTFISQEIVIEEAISSGVNEINDAERNQLIASPNPANSSINFILNGHSQNEIKSIEVFSIQGQSVYTQTYPTHLTIDISYYQTGLYLTKITTNNQSHTVRWSKI